MQLEAVAFARFQHGKILPDGKTAGMLIGDSTGLGKGRIIAGAICMSIYYEEVNKSCWSR